MSSDRCLDGRGCERGGGGVSGNRTAPVATVWRDVEVDAVASTLRAMLGLPPGEVAPGEEAAARRRPLPPTVRDLDAGGWIAWCLVGLVLLGDEPPQMAQVRVEAKRVVMALAMMRAGGNLSAAARSLGTSRRVLREGLTVVGLYPWRTTTATAK